MVRTMSSEGRDEWQVSWQLWEPLGKAVSGVWHGIVRVQPICFLLIRLIVPSLIDALSEDFSGES